MYRWSSWYLRSSAACVSQVDGRGVAEAERQIRFALCRYGAVVDHAGEYSPRAAVADGLLGSLGAAACRADQRQPLVPLVLMPGHGRGSLEPRCVLKDPRPAVDRRCGTAILRGSEAAGNAADVG